LSFKYWIRSGGEWPLARKRCCGTPGEGGRTPVAKPLHRQERSRNIYSISRIQQVFQGLPRGAFHNAVEKHRGDRHCKGFTCWDQLVTMVYAQLSGVRSLRELEAGFNQHRTQHYHLNTRPVHRSTLAGANANRSPEIFADLLRTLIEAAGRRMRTQRQEMLYLLDSTSIGLRGRGSEWTKASATRTPGLKVHVLYASEQHLPVHQTITAANVNDVSEGRKLCIERGATYVFDKGYCDYGWWSRIDAAGARFVTRLKANARVRVASRNAVPEQDAGTILADALVRFEHRSNRGGHRNHYEGPLRRIEVCRPGDTPLVLITNNLISPATEIAHLYKQRWEIELFFKWIKQHLSIKRFMGESENAVRIQLLTALIAYALVAMLNSTRNAPSKLWSTLAEIRTGLFHRPDTDISRWRRRRCNEAILTATQPGLFG
jgi:putative transposase